MQLIGFGGRKLLRFFLLVLSFLVLILLWYALIFIFGLGEMILPAPEQVAREMVQLVVTKHILSDISVSGARVLVGFGLAMAIGIPVGILCGVNRSFQILLEHHFNVLRFIPTVALIPLIILWFGIGETGKVFLILIRALPYLVLYISSAAADVEKSYLEMARVLGTPQRKIISTVVFPRILPRIWEICRIELGSSWSTIMLAEVLGANSGIGYRLVLAQRYVHTAELFALILIVTLLALSIDTAIKAFYTRLFPWAEKSKLLDL